MNYFRDKIALENKIHRIKITKIGWVIKVYFEFDLWQLK